MQFKQEEIYNIKSGKNGKTCNIKLNIKCPKHLWQKQSFREILDGYGCPACLIKNTSKAENEIYDFIRTFYNGLIIRNDRNVLKNNKELDIYFPHKNIAIEYDGLYWHNNVNNYYKFVECKAKNVRLVQITEYSW